LSSVHAMVCLVFNEFSYSFHPQCMDTNHDFNLPSADSFVSVIAAESTFVVMGQVRTAAVLEKVAGRRGGRKALVKVLKIRL
jgi:hypothetical protein